MKAKTQRKVRKAVSFVVCISILIGCLSIGQFTVFSAELSGYANETVVLIKNVGSGKYLTVHNGSDANGTNVYQWSSTQGLDQEFRLRYNLEKDCYTINPMCSSDGGNRVLDIVKKNGGEKACTDPQIRQDLIEEMADVLMYFNDVLLCYGITEEELKEAYTEKFKRNMTRW